MHPFHVFEAAFVGVFIVAGTAYTIAALAVRAHQRLRQARRRRVWRARPLTRRWPGGTIR